MKNKKDSIGAKNAESQESSTLLDPKKELQLVKQAQQGDVFARKVLITSNMGIIRTFALKYHSAMEYSDALQEATIGFMKAIDKFDANKGFRLNTYAGWWVRQRISRAAPEATTPVVFPSHFIEKNKKIKAAELLLSQEFESEKITPEMIAKQAGLTIDCVTNILNTPVSFSSLASPIGDDDRCLEDVIPDDEFDIYSSLEKEEISSKLASALESLSPRAADVITDYYGLQNASPFTFDEIGPRHDITRERARQLHLYGLKKLKVARGAELLNYFSPEKNNAVEGSSFYASKFFKKCSDLHLDAALRTLAGNERMAISAFFGLNEKRSCLSIERVAELVQMSYRATLRLIKNAHHKLMEFNSDLNEVIPLD